MKTLFTRFVLVAALSAAVLPAQRQDRGGTPPDPATMIQRRVQRLTTLLSLTDAQASQATTIFTNAHTAVAPLQTSMADARKSMRTAVKANDAGTISTVAANIGNLTGQILAIHSKAEAAFYAILTADQQAKLDQLGGAGFGPGGMGGMGMGMGGMRGPMGGRPGPR